MGTEPITQERYDRERAILDNMPGGAPPSAYADLEARPILAPAEALEDAVDEPAAETGPQAPSLLPSIEDRSAEVAQAYERTLAALMSDDGEASRQAMAEAVAYLVATHHAADLPATMAQFRAVLDQLQAVFGSGKAGGMLGKLLGGRR